MSRLSLKKTLLITAGVLSLMAQSILLLPESLGSPLFSFIPWGSAAIGAIFFVFSMVLFLIIISGQLAKKRLEWRANAILLLSQVLTVVGIYLLLHGFARGERDTGLLLSSLVTLLSTYGIFMHTIHHETSPPPSVEDGKELFADYTIDPNSNTNALKEQIESLTRQLNAEKHRNAQLTLLNELSQQLEA